MYSIKDAAKQTGLSEHTIRYYTDQGLVPMLQRDKNNARLFDETCIGTLITIKHLKNTGMKLGKIKEYIFLYLEGDATLEVRYQMIKKQYDIAKQQVEDANNRLAFLEYKVNNYKTVL